MSLAASKKMVALIFIFANTAVAAPWMSCRQIAGTMNLVRNLHVAAQDAQLTRELLNPARWADHARTGAIQALDPEGLIFLQGEVQAWKSRSAASLRADLLEARGCESIADLYATYRSGIQRLLEQVPPRPRQPAQDPLRSPVLAQVAVLESMIPDRLEGWKYRNLRPARTAADLQKLAVLSLALATLDRGHGTLAAQSPRPLDEAYDLVRENFDLARLKPLSLQEMPTVITRVMLDQLDPHTGYLTESERQKFEKANMQSFGLGAELSPAFGGLYVQRVTPGGPADRSGLLKAGDKLIGVDGHSLAAAELSDVIDWIRGPKGTRVQLHVERRNTRLSMAIARDQVPQPAVTIQSEARQLEDHKVGYVRFKEFSDHSADSLASTLERLKAQKVTGLVLDLRDNPGGYLDQAVQVVQLFENRAPGSAVYSLGSASTRVQRYAVAKRPAAFEGPLMILVNRASASAAEIVSGALQAYGRAVVVGSSSTFGKGSVQTVVPFSQYRSLHVPDLPPGALRVTTGFYFLPNGQSIQNVGVQPDIQIYPELAISAHRSEAGSDTHPLPAPAPLSQVRLPPGDQLSWFKQYEARMQPIKRHLTAVYVKAREKIRGGTVDPEKEAALQLASAWLDRDQRPASTASPEY